MAEVRLALRVDDALGGLEIGLEAPSDAAWQSGARFGVAYAYEHSPVHGRRVTVRVRRHFGHIVDTTEVLMAYAAAMAFWEAVGAPPPPGFALHVETASVTFPK